MVGEEEIKSPTYHRCFCKPFDPQGSRRKSGFIIRLNDSVCDVSLPSQGTGHRYIFHRQGRICPLFGFGWFCPNAGEPRRFSQSQKCLILCPSSEPLVFIPDSSRTALSNELSGKLHRTSEGKKNEFNKPSVYSLLLDKTQVVIGGGANTAVSNL